MPVYGVRRYTIISDSQLTKDILREDCHMTVHGSYGDIEYHTRFSIAHTQYRSYKWAIQPIDTDKERVTVGMGDESLIRVCVL